MTLKPVQLEGQPLSLPNSVPYPPQKHVFQPSFPRSSLATGLSQGARLGEQIQRLSIMEPVVKGQNGRRMSGSGGLRRVQSADQDWRSWGAAGKSSLIQREADLLRVLRMENPSLAQKVQDNGNKGRRKRWTPGTTGAASAKATTNTAVPEKKISHRTASLDSFDLGHARTTKPRSNARFPMKKSNLKSGGKLPPRPGSRPSMGHRSYSKELLEMLMATAGSDNDDDARHWTDHNSQPRLPGVTEGLQRTKHGSPFPPEALRNGGSPSRPDAIKASGSPFHPDALTTSPFHPDAARTSNSPAHAEIPRTGSSTFHPGALASGSAFRPNPTRTSPFVPVPKAEVTETGAKPVTVSPVPDLKQAASAQMTPHTVPCTVDESSLRRSQSQSLNSSTKHGSGNNSGIAPPVRTALPVPHEIAKAKKTGIEESRVRSATDKGDIITERKELLCDDADSMVSDITGLTGIFSRVVPPRNYADEEATQDPMESAPPPKIVPAVKMTPPPETAPLRSNSQPSVPSSVHVIGPSSSASGSRSMSTTMKKKKKTKKDGVSFGDVRVRVYERVLGINPSCTSGPPLSLGWRYFPERSCSIDAYECNKPFTRSPSELVLCREERELILLSLGYTRKQLANAVRMTIRLKNQRRKTIQNLATAGMEEMVENAGRKVKRLFVLNKSEERPKPGVCT